MATDTEPVAPVPAVERRDRGSVVVSRLTTTDHKKLGHLYLITPRRHNFPTLPKLRSESPTFDLRDPDVAGPCEAENTGQRDVLDAEGHKGDRP
ncbi:hypothetical protein AB0E85_35970 [Streptomyces sp. NPDC029044]|uniref:hypothetical protein n=1 Tax=Streptomyces sp. NPDC029044 TaxID=3157198 RepID=UPI0033CEE4D5